jgi:membrane protein
MMVEPRMTDNAAHALKKINSRETFLKDLATIFKQAANAWFDDNAPRLGAALAFYTLFSLAPVLIVVVSMAGMVFGQHNAHVDVARQSQQLIGAQGSAAIQSIIDGATNRPAVGWFATTLGFLTIFVGISGAFIELHDALNLIWRVDTTKRSFWSFALFQRLWSFLLVTATGLLLLVFLLVTAGLSAMERLVGKVVPTSILQLQLISVLLSLCMITIMFALIFKFIPDAKIQWRDVWPSATFTAILFTVGKVAIGFYLGHSALASVYGAAASLVIFLIWVYYSAQILLFGAELSHAYANVRGSKK